jgi:hypothetical protein
MSTKTVTLELPASLYTQLQKLAKKAQTDPVEVIAHLIAVASQRDILPAESDPVFELIGAYQSPRPLIDNIPVSEDPDLYLLAETMGENAAGLHAWEIAPTRYTEGPNRRPLRRDADEAGS